MTWGIKVPTADGTIDITASFRSLRVVYSVPGVTSIFTSIAPPAPYSAANCIAFAVPNDAGIPPACALIGAAGNAQVFMNQVAGGDTPSANWDVHVASFAL